MDKITKEKLVSELHSNLEYLAQLDTKTEEYERVADRIEQLQRIIESDQRHDKWIDWGLKAGAILLPIISYGSWFKKGLHFEEEGVVKSSFVRNLISKSNFKGK